MLLQTIIFFFALLFTIPTIKILTGNHVYSTNESVISYIGTCLFWSLLFYLKS